MMPNMFEFSIALRYLLPSKSHKTLSFVGILATLVISVVLWLLFVFVSITQSIENQWLSKMTALSAPLRIKPSKAYFNSYFYQIDEHAESSNYRLKSIKEKFLSEVSDPFDPDVDENIAHLPLPHKDINGHLIDPVKRLFHILNLKKSKFTFEEYALSAGALHLNLKKDGHAQTLNQVLYLTSFAKEALCAGSLIDEWDIDDINHLFKNEALELSLINLDELLKYSSIEKIEIEPFRLKLPKNFQLKNSYDALAEYNAEGSIKKLMILPEKQKQSTVSPFLKYGNFQTKDKSFNGQKLKNDQIYLSHIDNISLEGIKNTHEGRRFLFKGQFNHNPYHFELTSFDFKISSFKATKSSKKYISDLLERSTNKGPCPILAPKSFKEQGAKVGDKGYISYGAKTLSGFQEMKTSIIIAGFYDPGIFSVGAKVIVAPRHLIEQTGTAATTYALDPSETNGVLVFTPSFKEAFSVKQDLANELDKAEILSYFDLQTYSEYPFVKEILEQFASDKLIFFLVGFIILSVALSNVIFFMQLLVRDKGQEMSILRSIGASLKNIRTIFLISGSLIGLASALISFLLGLLTLHFIQPILKVLSLLLGQNVNLSQFYGISSSIHIPVALVILIFTLTPALCALSAFLATNRLKNKTCSEFLKEPR
jgi:lipoprotein-releasing system permease protein